MEGGYPLLALEVVEAATEGGGDRGLGIVVANTKLELEYAGDFLCRNTTVGLERRCFVDASPFLLPIVLRSSSSSRLYLVRFPSFRFVSLFIVVCVPRHVVVLVKLFFLIVVASTTSATDQLRNDRCRGQAAEVG